MDGKGRPKRTKKFQIDKTINHLKAEGKLKEGTMARPMEKYSKDKYYKIENGVYPLNLREEQHFEDLMFDSVSLNKQSAAFRREMKKEDALPKEEFKTVFELEDKQFIKERDDRMYKKTAVVSKRAKVARSVTAVSLK